MAARKGQQTPTQAHILPYSSSLGTKAAALYKASGRGAGVAKGYLEGYDGLHEKEAPMGTYKIRVLGATPKRKE